MLHCFAEGFPEAPINFGQSVGVFACALVPCVNVRWQAKGSKKGSGSLSSKKLSKEDVKADGRRESAGAIAEPEPKKDK